jgi:putative membrane protein
MLATSVAILLVSWVFPRVMSADGVVAALAAAFVLGLANAFVKPFFVLLTLPLTMVTLGAFLLVVNALMLWGVSAVVPGFHVNGFWGALGGSLLVSFVSWVLTWGAR